MERWWKDVCPQVMKVSRFGKGTGCLNVAFETVELAEEYAQRKDMEFKGKKIVTGFDLKIDPFPNKKPHKKRRKFNPKRKFNKKHRDGVKNKDLIGVEVGVEKGSDLAVGVKGKNNAEVVDDWEERAKAER